MNTLVAVLATIGLTVLFHSCGNASPNDSGVRAIEVFSPVGVVCYAILDERNHPVGGNCLRLK